MFLIIRPQVIHQEGCNTSDERLHCGGVRILTYGYFLVCIGLWFMVENIQVFQYRYFWFNSRFNDILNHTRFKEIIRSLNINDKIPPVYKDSFWG